jgi:hypothetical protein
MKMAVFSGLTGSSKSRLPAWPLVIFPYNRQLIHGWFEENCLEVAKQRPLCRFRYMDDNVIISPHCPGNVFLFLGHLKGIHEDVPFTMDTDSDGHLPLPDTGMYRKSDGSLSRKVFRRRTDMNLYPKLQFSAPFFKRTGRTLHACT